MCEEICFGIHRAGVGEALRLLSELKEDNVPMVVYELMKIKLDNKEDCERVKALRDCRASSFRVSSLGFEVPQTLNPKLLSLNPNPGFRRYLIFVVVLQSLQGCSQAGFTGYAPGA